MRYLADNFLMESQIKAGFRPEIQGLRAIAVAAVLVYHIWPDLLPGGFVGVDVFFVISGFLITEVLLRDVRTSGRIDLGRFYGRRIKRLLPAATLVLVATAACYQLLPFVGLENHAHQILASTFYVQNWYLGIQAVDYLGAEHAPGPLQHFWSLAVEEQYYIAWPLLFLFAQFVLSKAGFKVLTTLSCSVLIVFVSSLVHSAFYSNANPPMAYFATSTRAWELALGGLLAVLAGKTTLRVSASVALCTAGIFLILTSFFVIDSNTVFPGLIALLPTIGTALIICAGDSQRFWAPQTLLRSPPLQYLGDISYSLYLWHWPIIVFYQSVSARTIGWVDGLVLLSVSSALAHQTKTLVEDTFRRRDYWNLGQKWPVALALVCIALSTASGLLLLHKSRSLALEPLPPEIPSNGLNSVADYTPSAISARRDIPLVSKIGCHTPQSEPEPRNCSFGEESSLIHVAVVGDSHALQWAPAFRELAKINGWRVTFFTKSACAFSDVAVRVGKPARRFDECLDWSKAVVVKLRELRPTHVVIGQSAAQQVYGIDDRQTSAVRLAESYVNMWQRVAEHGAKVIAIKDTPRLLLDVPVCLSTINKRVEDCASERTAVLDVPNRPDPLVIAAQRWGGAELISLDDEICLGATCPAVIDGVLVWRDRHHLTTTFVKSIASALAERLQAALNMPVRHIGQPSDNSDKRSVSLSEIEQAKQDYPDAYGDKCLNRHSVSDPVVCEYGVPDGGLHLVLAGDSRAAQWLPALQELGVSRSIRISTVLTHACPLGDLIYQGRDCSLWALNLIKTVNGLGPDLLIYSQSRGYRVDAEAGPSQNLAILAQSFKRKIEQVSETKRRIVLLPDTPRLRANMNECLAAETGKVDLICSVNRQAALPPKGRPDPLVMASGDPSVLELLNLNHHICPEKNGVCPPLIEGQLVWRSKYLVTASFSRSLSNLFESHLFDQ